MERAVGDDVIQTKVLQVSFGPIKLDLAGLTFSEKRPYADLLFGAQSFQGIHVI